MKYKKLGSAIGVVTLVFGLSGWAHSACVIDADSAPNATSVQDDSGNGNFSCSAYSTPSGSMEDVDVVINDDDVPIDEVKIDIINGKVTWSVATSGGVPLVDVDLVSVSRSNGKRCNYAYGDQVAGDAGLVPADGKAQQVTVCSDRYIDTDVQLPPPPEPISTLGNGCDAAFDYNDTSGRVEDERFDVAIGYTKQFLEGGLEGAAICTKGGGQRECVNECVPTTGASGENCTVTEGIDGEWNLDCAPCEWEYRDLADSEKDLKYCWYWENRVCDADSYPIDAFGNAQMPGYCNNRTDDTFIPSPKKKSLNATIDVTTGSDCYTVTIGPLYGGYMYSYQYCPPSP